MKILKNALLEVSKHYSEISIKALIEQVEKLEITEKEQIMKAFDDGYCSADLELTDSDIEQYYNETYKQ